MEKFEKSLGEQNKIHCLEWNKTFNSIGEACFAFQCTRKNLLRSLREGVRLYGHTIEWVK